MSGPEICEDEVLPSDWQTYAEKRQIPEDQIFTSCAFRYEIEIDEAANCFRVIRYRELTESEAGDMGLPPFDDCLVILEAASEVELYHKIIDM